MTITATPYVNTQSRRRNNYMKHTLPLLIGLLIFAEAKTVYINPDEATRSRLRVEELMLGGQKSPYFPESQTIYINPDQATRSRIAVEELMLGGIKGRNKPIIQEEPNPYQFLFDDD